MALAVLLSLAIITYHPVDNPVAQRFSVGQALNPTETPAQNWLGLVGALLARVLVPQFLGYTVLLFTGLLAAWGYVIFRGRPIVNLPFISVLTVMGAFLVACLFGWTGQTLDVDLSRWGGTMGMGIAGWMQRIFGTVGSFILLVLGGLITLLLAIDHDIQRSIDRVSETLHAFRSGTIRWWQSIQDRWAERREERARRRAERREARAQRRQQKTEQSQAEELTSPSSPPRTGSSESATAAPSEDNEPTSPPPSGDTTDSAPTLVDDGDAMSPYARRNDLFRSGDGASEQDGEPADSRPDQTSASPSPSAPRPTAPDTAASDGSTEQQPEADAPPKDVELQVQEQIEEEKADDIERAADVDDDTFEYVPPSIDLLDAEADSDPTVDMDELKQNKQILLDKLDTYNIEIQNIKAVVGPTVTRYELTPAPGIKVSRIKSLEDDLAMAMAAQGIRMIAPIPGKSAVGVEIPNRHRELVRLRAVIGTAKFRDTDMELPIPIGKTIEGEVFLADLTKMPHLLIAGATGSGKSVGLNTLIMGLIYASHPANLKFVIIDPKKIELQQHGALRDHFLAIPEDIDEEVVTDVEEALGVLKSCEKEMENRYDLLSKASVRGIKDYNKKFQRGDLDPDEGHAHMPYIVVVVDELADLMMTAGKDIEGPIARLAQMARAVGIHLVLATQRPSVDVITGLIKANFPSRMAYEVASRVDSRTILDQIGAEGLVGNGDLLYMSGSRLIRLQGPFVSIDEVERINEFIADQPGRGPYRLPSLQEAGVGPDVTLGVEDTDELFEEAAHVIVRRQQGSVSLLQRKLAVGYTRAARIVDQLEDAGIVGPYAGTKAREVLVESEEELDRLMDEDDED
jgi:S-DNA-T family DNA segregation ATPase FtsK/SpoIIIE